MMWRSFHVHYYDHDKSGLLLDAVRPFLQWIAPQVSGAHYLLHWLRGSHVRINVNAEPESFAATVLPALDEVIKPYLAAHPSTAVIDAATLEAQHARLAQLEHEPGPVTPLYADNSVHEAGHDQRLQVLGSVQAADLLADFYDATTPLAFEMLDHAHRRGNPLAGLCFDTMIATAHALSGVGLRRGFVSFRSHAEAFLSWWPEAEGLRQAWDRHYTAHAGKLAERVRHVMRAVESPTQPEGLVCRWVQEAAPFSQRGAELLAAGELSMDPPWAGRFSEDDELIAEMARKSAFHNHPRPAGEVVDQLWFDQYRLILNYTYLQLTRLGLSPVERFLLCHLAANTVEDLYGVAATEVRLPAPGELLRSAASPRESP
ncbi:thiopeptide maturation pyridine synthase [Streptomyces nigrescens]